MKSSYQHIRFGILPLFFLLSFTALFGQPNLSHKYKGIPFAFPKEQAPQEILSWLNNHGYPFAQIELDTLHSSTETTHLCWNVAIGKKVTLDTLVTSGAFFNKKTFQRCLNYPVGSPYNEEKLNSITQTLNQISFLKPNPKVEIRLHSATFSIHLKTERKKNNLISALVALQPKPNSTESILTGNIDLELSNILKQAEIIEFHWKRPQPQSQSLALKVGSPFTAGLPIGFQFEFASFLRDSTFSNSEISIRLLTRMNDQNGFSAALNKSTNTHFNPSSVFGNTTNQSYSLRYSKSSNLINTINFLLEGKAGTRSIQYESNTSQKKIYALKGKAWSRLKLAKLLFSDFNFEVNATISDSLFNNEIERLGGTKNLRAFIEESIYASQYAFVNLDFGVNLGEDIQSFLFADAAYVRMPQTRTYYDTGVGMRFQQETGTVSITYGVGNIENNGLQLRNGRVGITFSSMF